MRTPAAFMAGAGSAAIVAVGWMFGAQAIAATTAATSTSSAGANTQSSASSSGATPSASASASASASGSSSNAAGSGTNSGSSSSSGSGTTTSGVADGTYTGQDVYEPQFGGDVQVSVTFAGGVITDVTTISCNATHGAHQACPMLRSEAISAQSANISTIGRATYTSLVYIQSLQSALDAAGYTG